MFLSLTYREFNALELNSALGCLLTLCLQTPQAFDVVVKLPFHLPKLFAIWKLVKPLLKATHHIFPQMHLANLLIKEPLGVMTVFRILN